MQDLSDKTFDDFRVKLETWLEQQDVNDAVIVGVLIEAAAPRIRHLYEPDTDKIDEVCVGLGDDLWSLAYAD
jgi:hypothetical protein